MSVIFNSIFILSSIKILVYYLGGLFNNNKCGRLVLLYCMHLRKEVIMSVVLYLIRFP